MCRIILLAMLGWGLLLRAHAPGAEPDMPAVGGGAHGYNLPTPTWGGKQLWTDELLHGEWRIQRHAYTGHYRLLDDQGRRRACSA